jgi:4-coumarate--CoA ligase
MSESFSDYPVAIWATHRLGGVISYVPRNSAVHASLNELSSHKNSGANPDFSASELLYQIEQTNPKVLVVHPEALGVAQSAATLAKIPSERVICFDVEGLNNKEHLTVNQIIEEGKKQPQAYEERRLRKGEAKTKLAFLSFSSGTTGRPKV